MSTHDEAVEQTEQIEATASGTSGRRELFTKAGAAAAVAAVAGLAVSKTAEAADGATMLIGRNNVGNSTNTTALTNGSSFYVEDGVTNGGNGASIRGRNTTADGIGVRGESSGSQGRGVYGENSGSDGSGVYGVTTANGSNGAGVRGHNDGDGHGVKGQAAKGGAGVYGLHVVAGGRGVYGHHDNSTQDGTGVLGAASLGTGVVGRGSSYDVLADRSGKIGLSKAGTTGAAASGTLGTIARDAAGNLWYCYATDKWEQITGLPAGNTPGFTAISPIRAYDGRIPAIPQSGAFAAKSSKVISIKDGRDQTTGVVDAANAVPSDAKAVAYNVTATNTTAGSFLSVVPGNVATSAVSSLNWSGPGVSIANAGIVGVNGSREVRIIAGPGGSFDAIIDITGYFT